MNTEDGRFGSMAGNHEEGVVRPNIPQTSLSDARVSSRPTARNQALRNTFGEPVLDKPMLLLTLEKFGFAVDDFGSARACSVNEFSTAFNERPATGSMLVS
jgi:hypothetical protein